jgi:hypothetical protein
LRVEPQVFERPAELEQLDLVRVQPGQARDRAEHQLVAARQRLGAIVLGHGGDRVDHRAQHRIEVSVEVIAADQEGAKLLGPLLVLLDQRAAMQGQREQS